MASKRTLSGRPKRPDPDLSHLDRMSVDQLWELVGEWCGGNLEDPVQPPPGLHTFSSLHTAISVTYHEAVHCEYQLCGAETKDLSKHVLTFPRGSVTSQYLCQACSDKWVRLVRKRARALAKIRGDQTQEPSPETPAPGAAA